MALAQQLKAPVGFAFRGKQFIEYDNPYQVGMTGLLGYGGAYGAMHGCELLLLLGTDFPYEQFMPPDRQRRYLFRPRPGLPDPIYLTLNIT